MGSISSNIYNQLKGMKIYRQKSPDDNGIAVIKNLALLLNVRLSATSLANIKQNSSYPSLESLSISLSGWNIENMGIRISADQLSEIPYPAIAHLHKNKGHFVVLKKIENDQIQYIDPEIGIVNENIKEFEKKWSGAALLVQANEKSGEENYNENRKAEMFNQISQYTSVSLFVIALLFTVFSLTGISYRGCKLNCVKAGNLPTLIQYEERSRTIQSRRD